jgi:hypothetical protein
VKYALIIYNSTVAESLPIEERQRIYDKFMDVLSLPSVSGAVRLQRVESATTVRFEGGKTMLTDGPFVESKEYLGGLIMVEAANLDDAIALATRLQDERPYGAIEVRPMIAIDQPPDPRDR